jgi:hypothetical protein
MRCGGWGGRPVQDKFRGAVVVAVAVVVVRWWRCCCCCCCCFWVLGSGLCACLRRCKYPAETFVRLELPALDRPCLGSEAVVDRGCLAGLSTHSTLDSTTLPRPDQTVPVRGLEDRIRKKEYKTPTSALQTNCPSVFADTTSQDVAAAAVSLLSCRTESVPDARWRPGMSVACVHCRFAHYVARVYNKTANVPRSGSWSAAAAAGSDHDADSDLTSCCALRSSSIRPLS